jgi:DNA-binding FadR family transcriptional regulator
MPRRLPPFDLITYLAEQARTLNGNGAHEEDRRVPSLTDLSKDNNISIATLREQLGVARALGLVEVRPKTGIRRLDYTFTPAVFESLSYAIAADRAYFDQFAALRNQIEIAFWPQAVKMLTAEDKAHLTELVNSAQEKLAANPIRLPQKEHRELHLTIFRHLENIFVQGVLESYWDAYEEVGLARYEGLDYLEKVWDYHRRIVDCILTDDIEGGHQLLREHMELIYVRPKN